MIKKPDGRPCCAPTSFRPAFVIFGNSLEMDSIPLLYAKLTNRMAFYGFVKDQSFSKEEFGQFFSKSSAPYQLA